MSHAHAFGAAGDGKTDDTAAIQHVLEAGDGHVELAPGDYRITRPLELDTTRFGRVALTGSGGTARIIMAGPGPALRVTGSHGGTADPNSVKPEVARLQRLPTITGVEIVGEHDEADGIELTGTMHAVLIGVLVRQVRHGIVATGRNRNIILDACHVYHNTGVGVFLRDLDLHQANITGCHISYNRLGGIRIENSEIRNLQITGCDIEYNNFRAHKAQPDVPTAEIYIDTSAPRSTVREFTIVSNTIQATHSPGGANIRIIGSAEPFQHPGMATISGNLIGNQDVNVHLTHCRGITITGNYIYAGYRRNVLVESSEQIVLSANVIGHNPDRRKTDVATSMTFRDSRDLIVTGCNITDAPSGKHTFEEVPQIERDGLVEIVSCQNVTLASCQVFDGVPHGLRVADSSFVSVTGCTIVDRRAEPASAAPVRWTGTGRANLIASCTIGGGRQPAMQIDPAAGVAQQQNITAGA